MRRITSTFLLLLAVIFVSDCQTLAVSDSAQIETISIKEAKDLSTGETVSVSGIVTVQSGAFASSISSGFAVQDSSGGIYIVDTKHTFQLGEKVVITGKRAEESGQSSIILESAKKLTGSGTVTSRSVRTGHLGEAEEGILIRVDGYVTRIKGDPPYGYKVFIDDNSGECQIFTNASTGLVQYAKDLKIGDFISVTGFAGQYGEAYEVIPRILSDIEIRATQE